MTNLLANAGQNAKTIVAAIGTLVSSLMIEFPSAHWVPVVASVLTMLGVHLVPNTPNNQPPTAA